MHIGHGHFFQNLDGRSDHEVWRTEMGLADAAEGLGFDSVWAVEHRFAAIAGTPDECRQELERYSELPHLALHTSYVPPFTAEESEDCYLRIIDAFKR